MLVLAPTACGGTGLLRAAAALPGVAPRMLPGAMVQTLHVDDLAAVAAGGASCRSLGESLATMPATLRDRWFARAWLAFPVAVSLALHVFVDAFRLPVVWIQIRLHDMARAARYAGAAPERYWWFYRTWFACGFAAFCAVLAIVWLMRANPGW